ncbi:hypothetical protein ACIHEJ_32780 [Streptomyces sp. NPDC052301]|uniref:hypothetical protein n=1 Tax=Streptomyces sp. NPDC052301 TaxID=3365687 RepID=UPI0037D47468
MGQGDLRAWGLVGGDAQWRFGGLFEPEGAFDGVDLSGSEGFAAYNRVKEELGVPDTCRANDIAAPLSVDPGALETGITASGPGVLALTACGREHGRPAGALPV